MIILDGLSSPGLPFGVYLFFGFEFLTLVTEFFVLLGYNYYLNFMKRKSMDVLDIVIITFLMNVASALFAFPIWRSLHIGGL